MPCVCVCVYVCVCVCVKLRAYRAVNVPTHLVDCLLRQEAERGGLRALLIHISTDQVSSSAGGNRTRSVVIGRTAYA